MFTINVSTKKDFISFTHREIGMPLKLMALMNNNVDYIEVLNENENVIWEATRVTDDFCHPKFDIKSKYDFK